MGEVKIGYVNRPTMLHSPIVGDVNTKRRSGWLQPDIMRRSEDQDECMAEYGRALGHLPPTVVRNFKRVRQRLCEGPLSVRFSYSIEQPVRIELIEGAGEGSRESIWDPSDGLIPHISGCGQQIRRSNRRKWRRRGSNRKVRSMPTMVPFRPFLSERRMCASNYWRLVDATSFWIGSPKNAILREQGLRVSKDFHTVANAVPIRQQSADICVRLIK